MFSAMNLHAKQGVTILTRLPMWGLVKFLSLVVLIAYAYLSMQIRMTNAEELRDLGSQVQQLKQDYVVLTESLQGRIQALETTTYVDIIQAIENKKTVPPVLESWQKNRDAAISKRLEALERRLYAVEGPR